MPEPQSRLTKSRFLGGGGHKNFLSSPQVRFVYAAPGIYYITTENIMWNDGRIHGWVDL